MEEKVKIPVPVVGRTAKKTIWKNFRDFAKAINREEQHVTKFFTTELVTTASTNPSGNIIIAGRFRPEQIESIMKKYMINYVRCNNCKKAKGTKLRKDKKLRLWFLDCPCGASQSVPKMT